MNKLNLLCLILNAAAFIMLSSSNITIAKTPAMFNPDAVEFRGKTIIAKTFTTWCRYCRQRSNKDAEIKTSNDIQIKEIKEFNGNSVNADFVQEENSQIFTQFFNKTDLKLKIPIFLNQV